MSVTTVERGESALAISREEAAHRLGLSLNSFERHVQPSLRTVKVGRRILIPVSALEAFLEGEADA
jgi:excisionase family DNA binding protein